jgi:dienelactone hydrolase
MSTNVLDGWVKGSFSAAGITHDTYRKGSGPLVVVVHEVPGITPKVTAFADEVVAAGFTVVMPDLLGTPGKEMSNGYAMSSLVKVCVSKEFHALARNKTSPIIGWLRALGRSLHTEVGGRGIGAVGMCFSGGFALGMMLDDHMLAPVLSQPSMPFAMGAKRAADLNLSPDDALVVRRRAEEGCQVLGLRFTEDRMVGTRFDSLRELLGDAFVAIELPSSKKTDHSVLTEQRDDASVQRVIGFFREKLL